MNRSAKTVPTSRNASALSSSSPQRSAMIRAAVQRSQDWAVRQEMLIFRA
jgi:hypothetical protein